MDWKKVILTGSVVAALVGIWKGIEFFKERVDTYIETKASVIVPAELAKHQLKYEKKVEKETGHKEEPVVLFIEQTEFIDSLRIYLPKLKQVIRDSRFRPEGLHTDPLSGLHIFIKDGIEYRVYKSKDGLYYFDNAPVKITR